LSSRSLLSDDEKELQAERVKAINHVKRAIYDIDESLLIYYIESAANFKHFLFWFLLVQINPIIFGARLLP
jgi:hypothetical protein